jgi:hypothetical protein
MCSGRGGVVIGLRLRDQAVKVVKRFPQIMELRQTVSAQEAIRNPGIFFGKACRSSAILIKQLAIYEPG